MVHRMTLTAQKDMQPSTAEACGAPAPVPSTARAARGHPAGSPYGAWSSDNSRSPGTPAVRSSRGLTPDARPLAAFRRALPLFSKEVLQRCIIQHRIGQQPLQTSVLVLEPFKALGLADIHTAISGFPFVERRIADAVPAAQISDGNPGLVLLQNADDLIFSEPAALHLWSYRLGQSLPQNWMRRRGQRQPSSSTAWWPGACLNVLQLSTANVLVSLEMLMPCCVLNRLLLARGRVLKSRSWQLCG